MARLFSTCVALASLAATAWGQSLRLVNPPKQVILNDRKHPVTVAYTGVRGQADIHVDLLDGGNQWVGGGMTTVQAGSGEAKVPMEVRVAPGYTGPLTLRTYLSNNGAQDRLATAPELTGLTVSKVPTDAIGVICQPSLVAPGQGFNLNLWYTQTHARESDIIAVALHADTKEYFGGCSIPVSGQQGQLTCRFNLKYGSTNLPLKFKAWISPRGEEAPNYVSYTMIQLPLGWNVNNDCPNIGKQESSPAGLPPANWIELVDVPATIPKGQTVPFGVKYNLVGAQKADVELALMTWDWSTHASNPIVTTKATLSANKTRDVIQLAVPANAQPGPDGLYAIVYTTATGKGYDDSLAEDRKYKISFGGYTQPALRQGGNVNNGNGNGNGNGNQRWWQRWSSLLTGGSSASSVETAAATGGDIAVQVDDLLTGLNNAFFGAETVQVQEEEAGKAGAEAAMDEPVSGQPVQQREQSKAGAEAGEDRPLPGEHKPPMMQEIEGAKAGAEAGEDRPLPGEPVPPIVQEIEEEVGAGEVPPQAETGPKAEAEVAADGGVQEEVADAFALEGN